MKGKVALVAAGTLAAVGVAALLSRRRTPQPTEEHFPWEGEVTGVEPEVEGVAVTAGTKEKED